VLRGGDDVAFGPVATIGTDSTTRSVFTRSTPALDSASPLVRTLRFGSMSISWSLRLDQYTVLVGTRTASCQIEYTPACGCPAATVATR